MEEYCSFRIPAGGLFRILQLTDIHYGGSVFSKKEDRAALAAVTEIVRSAKPDLIVLTGDNVFPIPPKRGSLMNGRAVVRVANCLEGFGIPWTTVFGNHDVESFAFCGKKKMAEKLKSFPHSVFRRGPEGLTGEGNSFIKLLNSDGKLVMALALLDSNMYAGKGFYSGFDHIHQDQLDWHRRELLAMSEGLGKIVPSLAFFHIPVTEFKQAWHAYTHGDGSVAYHFGEVGETNDYFGVPKKRENVFEQLVQLGSTRGIFVGHDHLNNVSLTYRGIRLTYGMSIDFLAYRKIKKWKSQRGGTLITVGEDAAFDVKHIELETLRAEEKV